MLLLWWAVVLSGVVVVHCVLETEQVKPPTFSGYPHMVKQALHRIYGDPRCSVVIVSGKSALAPLSGLMTSSESKVPYGYIFDVQDYGTVKNYTLCPDDGSFDDQLAVLTFTGEFTGKPATLPTEDLQPQEGLQWSLGDNEVVKAVPVATNDSREILYHLNDGEVDIKKEDVGRPTLTGEDVLVGVHSKEGLCGTNETPCKDIRLSPSVSSCIRKHMTPSTFPMFRKLFKFVDQSWVPFCGMTIISPRTALTAAACVVNTTTNGTANKNLYSVIDGEIIDFIINYEDITHSWTYQIALVIFANRYVEMAQLPHSELKLAAKPSSKLLVLSGCGSGFQLRPLLDDRISFNYSSSGNVYNINFVYEQETFITSDMGGPTLYISFQSPIIYQIVGVHTSSFEQKYVGEDIFVAKQVHWIKEKLVN